MGRLSKHVLRCSAVLFDLDGVLVESSGSVERSWRSWALRNGLDPRAVSESCHGRRSVETVEALTPHLDARAEASRIESEQAADRMGLTACAGADRLIRALPRERWAVVTSGSRLLALARLRAGGIPVPRVLMTADDVRRGKPDPEGYLAAAGRLGLRPDACVVIEDTPAGVLAARAAGCRVIGVTGVTGALTSTADGPDLVVKTLADLGSAVDDGDLLLTGVPGGAYVR